MVRKGLIVVALLALAMPVSAQEEYVWTSKRPDGHAPLGVMGGRTLEKGEIEVSYDYSQFDSKGIWFDSDSMGLELTLEYYEVAPLELSNRAHRLAAAYGITDDLTVMVNAKTLTLERSQLTADGIYYVTQTEGIGDAEVAALYRFFNEGPIRAHLQAGILVPVGEVNTLAETPFSGDAEALPYDQRRGIGTWSALPGLTVSMQNEKASIGAQMKGRISMGTNGRGYAAGNEWQGTAWGAFRINEYFSVSGRIQWTSWAGIDGEDNRLDPLRDPGNDGYFLDGERIDLPVGINFYLPEGSRFAGHRLSLEAFFPVSHDYEGPQFGMDWGINLGYKIDF